MLAKRLFLLGIFAVIPTLALVFDFRLYGASSGPYQPMAILWSWSFWLLKFLVDHVLVIPNLSNIFLIVLLTLTFSLYLIFLLLLNNVVRKIVRFPIPVIPLTIHSLGTLTVLWFLGKPGHHFEFGFNLFAWGIPISMIVAYFTIEWRLALKSYAAKPGLGHG